MAEAFDGHVPMAWRKIVLLLSPTTTSMPPAQGSQSKGGSPKKGSPRKGKGKESTSKGGSVPGISSKISMSIPARVPLALSPDDTSFTFRAEGSLASWSALQTGMTEAGVS